MPRVLEVSAQRHGGLDGDDPQLMRYGKHGIQNTISTTTGSQGGYVVPQGFSNQLEEAVKWRARSREWLANSKTETGNPMPWPAINDTNNKGRIIGQNAFR